MKTAGCVCVCARARFGKTALSFFFYTAFFDLLLKSRAGERLGRTSKRAGGLGRLFLKKGGGEEGVRLISPPWRMGGEGRPVMGRWVCEWDFIFLLNV